MSNTELIADFIQRPLLVITDKSKHSSVYDRSNTMFLCLDRETTRELEEAGYTVYGFTDDELFSEWEDLYQQYAFPYAKPAWIDDEDVAVLYQQVAMRSVEIYAPILYYWRLVVTAINCNSTTRVIVDVDDKWLRVIMEMLLSQKGVAA